MSDGRLAARAVIGGLFIGHGTQKLLGWFGGPGRAGTEGMMEALEMRPARLHAAAAGVTETAGGALLAAGLATPLAAAGLTGVMTTAIKKVHVPKSVGRERRLGVRRHHDRRRDRVGRHGSSPRIAGSRFGHRAQRSPAWRWPLESWRRCRGAHHGGRAQGSSCGCAGRRRHCGCRG